jgi:uracil-DNA glycosylase
VPDAELTTAPAVKNSKDLYNTLMHVSLEPTWKKVLESGLKHSYYIDLQEKIDSAYQSTTVFPPQELILNAFTLCPFEAVRVVILGQDPYHGPGQAHGLSFSVPDGVKIPPSLKNIYKELYSDIGKEIPLSGNLSQWAAQGVLLLNATLTVESGKPGSHQGLGWEQFTDSIIKKISDQKEHVVFLLWGNFARTKATLIDETKHLALQAPHPSPFSAYTGFFGCRHFSKTNDYLTKHNLPTIDW